MRVWKVNPDLFITRVSRNVTIPSITFRGAKALPNNGRMYIVEVPAGLRKYPIDSSGGVAHFTIYTPQVYLVVGLWDLDTFSSSRGKVKATSYITVIPMDDKVDHAKQLIQFPFHNCMNPSIPKDGIMMMCIGTYEFPIKENDFTTVNFLTEAFLHRPYNSVIHYQHLYSSLGYNERSSKIYKDYSRKEFLDKFFSDKKRGIDRKFLDYNKDFNLYPILEVKSKRAKLSIFKNVSVHADKSKVTLDGLRETIRQGEQIYESD